MFEQHQNDRDRGGDTSLALAARMFSVWRGVSFTETEAAVFMALFKLARAERSANPDNWVDGAAYVAMAGAAEKPGPLPVAAAVDSSGADGDGESGTARDRSHGASLVV